MTTKVYGASDDLIEFDGEVHGEAGYSDKDEDETGGTLVAFDDGTQVVVKYGKPGGLAVWSITPLVKGSLFERIDVCDDEDADIYSDVLHFKDGLKSAVVAQKWERVH